ncbi:MAG: hypothetical protein KC729_08840 [Candidatus Eisenbacteria bacterium]|uniref:POTRA domain-containing protein n=1 Tax=Eiseniibacteriota bacterium TaxID=2212470 RepID=A0A956M0P6_UNCEI|nr:hypothetical protein [Candidatus Eisenbacteria bacterium]
MKPRDARNEGAPSWVDELIGRTGRIPSRLPWAFVLLSAWCAWLPNAQASEPGGGPAILVPAQIVVRGTDRIDSDEVARALARGGATPDLLDAFGSRLVEAGFLEARLELTITDSVQLTVDEGESARWDSLAVSVRRPPGRVGPVVPAPALEGDYSRVRFERAVRLWIADWAEAGYPFAIATVESVTVRNGNVRAGLRCDPGPLARVSRVEFPGAVRTQAGFLEDWIRFRPDRLFRESRLERGRRRLEQSGLFLEVEAPEVELQDDGTVALHYPVREGPHNRAEGALGYAGASETVSGYASLHLGNLFGTGRRLRFEWERAAAEQSRYDLGYHEPLLFGWPLGVDLAVSQEVQDSTYTLDRWEAGLEATVGVDFYVSAGVERRRAVVGAEPSEVIRRSSTVFGARYEGLRAGWRGSRAAGTFRTGHSRIDPPGDEPNRRERLDRVEVEAEQFRHVGPLVVRWHGRAGGLAAPTETLSPAEALWVGGATTVRGSRERAVAARRFGASQIEVGAPFLLGEGRAYGFFDAAWFRPLSRSHGVDDLTGWGFGMAARTGRQTLALDLGIPRSGGFSEGRIHLRLQTAF